MFRVGEADIPLVASLVFVIVGGEHEDQIPNCALFGMFAKICRPHFTLYRESLIFAL